MHITQKPFCVRCCSRTTFEFRAPEQCEKLVVSALPPLKSCDAGASVHHHGVGGPAHRPHSARDRRFKRYWEGYQHRLCRAGRRPRPGRPEEGKYGRGALMPVGRCCLVLHTARAPDMLSCSVSQPCERHPAGAHGRLAGRGCLPSGRKRQRGALRDGCRQQGVCHGSS